MADTPESILQALQDIEVTRYVESKSESSNKNFVLILICIEVATLSILAYDYCQAIFFRLHVELTPKISAHIQ